MNQTTAKGTRFYYVISVAILVFILNACSKSSTCLTPKVVALRGGFYYRDTSGNFLDTLLVNANLYFGVSNNYMQNLKQRKQFYLPLAQNTDSIMLFFQAPKLYWVWNHLTNLCPILCRVFWYKSSGFPKPTINQLLFTFGFTIQRKLFIKFIHYLEVSDFV